MKNTLYPTEYKEIKKHNPGYRLVEKTVFDGSKFQTLVFGMTNEGLNAGLEIYFKKTKDGHFYKSFRYLEDELPKKYCQYWEELSGYIGVVESGNKLILN